MSPLRALSLLAIGLVVAFVVFLAYQNRRLLFDTCPPSAAAPYAPDPRNDKALIVYGWNGDELRTIMSNFAAIYDMKDFKYLVRTEDRRLKVLFPHDIEPNLFSFLVNYVQYPKDIDAKGRSIASFGTATLTADFDLPSPALIGRQALFYVPAEDDEYDRVFVRVGEDTYENSFAGKCWQPMKDPRMPTQTPSLEQ